MTVACQRPPAAFGSITGARTDPRFQTIILDRMV
jgi:hypothetical protein